LRAAVNSDKCVILADGSKMGKVTFRTFLKLGEIPFTVITDSNAPENVRTALRQNGIPVKIAGIK